MTYTKPEIGIELVPSDSGASYSQSGHRPFTGFVFLQPRIRECRVLDIYCGVFTHDKIQPKMDQKFPLEAPAGNF